ncbi:STAS domain-containing protein [Nonomuraea sp. NPDC050536]|uniref:STAS domain-containing protein n=1 Tax=Nonomuraea sp. NPDC050536 TaxID=3364366 RepID=UPI0037C90249
MRPWHLTTQSRNGTTVITIVGELDIATRPELAACVDRALAAHRGPLIIDLSGLTFIDAHGLGGLLALRDVAALSFAGRPYALVRILELAGLEGVFDSSAIPHRRTGSRGPGSAGWPAATSPPTASGTGGSPTARPRGPDMAWLRE